MPGEVPRAPNSWKATTQTLGSSPQHLRSGTILPNLQIKHWGRWADYCHGVVARLGRTGLVARLTGVCVALAKGISNEIDINK